MRTFRNIFFEICFDEMEIEVSENVWVGLRLGDNQKVEGVSNQSAFCDHKILLCWYKPILFLFLTEWTYVHDQSQNCLKKSDQSLQIINRVDYQSCRLSTCFRSINSLFPNLASKLIPRTGGHRYLWPDHCLDQTVMKR